MKILVTGADGFIGKYLIDELLNHQVDIIATSHNKENAEKCSWFKRVQYIEHDFNNNKEDVYSLFEKPDLLIHLAWEGLPNYKELFHIEKNLFSNYYFLKNMVCSGLKDMVIVGTCLEYGMRNGCLSESLDPKPIVPYSIAKNTLREFVEQMKHNYDFQYKWIRLFYMYGEGQSKNSILEQLKEALNKKAEYFNMSGGEQLRDYLPIEKVAEYIAKISLQNEITGIINCCSGTPISIRRLVEEYLEKNNMNIKLNLGYYPYADYEPMAFWGDSTKLLRLIRNDEV